MFSLICAWINSWVNNREDGDLKRYRVHYDVIVMGIVIFFYGFPPAEPKELLRKDKGWLTHVGPNSWWHMEYAQHAAYNPNSKRLGFRHPRRLKDPPIRFEGGHNPKKAPNPHPPGTEQATSQYLGQWELSNYNWRIYASRSLDELKVWIRLNQIIMEWKAWLNSDKASWLMIYILT